MEDHGEFHPSLPLVSRLDHLDFTMKSLEGRQHSSKWGSSCASEGIERQSTPLDLAVREAYFKGSLMDRVAFLERRLLQICMEMESSSGSGISSLTSGHASSSQGSKSEQSSSLPISDLPNRRRTHSFPLLQSKYEPQPKEIVIKKEEEKKNSKPKKHKLVKDKPIKEDRVCKSGSKMASSKWPRFKILGC